MIRKFSLKFPFAVYVLAPVRSSPRANADECLVGVPYQTFYGTSFTPYWGRFIPTQHKSSPNPERESHHLLGRKSSAVVLKFAPWIRQAAFFPQIIATKLFFFILFPSLMIFHIPTKSTPFCTPTHKSYFKKQRTRIEEPLVVDKSN